MFGLYDMFTGGSLSRITIFALGVMPYISSSIILQLLTVVWPYLERLSKEGELGRRKITQYTRYLTLLLAVVQSLGIAIWLERNTQIRRRPAAGLRPGLGLPPGCVLTLTTGTMFIMWLGEQITERGIGNGMSLHHLLGHRRQLPAGGAGDVRPDADRADRACCGWRCCWSVMVAVIAAIIYVERGHRRITVQYAKRVVGRRQYGGSSTHIPLKVNTGGVIPVIFASSILTFPATLAGDVRRPGGWADAVVRQIAYGMPLYNLLYVAAIIFFAYFYTAIIFNPDDVAENMRKYGGFIPGHPSGQAHGGVHRHDPGAHHAGRRALPGAGRDPAGVPDDRLQGGADSVHRRTARRDPAAWFTTRA